MYKFLTQIDKEDWVQLVDSSSVASFFQTPSCYHFYQSLPFVEPFVYGVEHQGQLLAVACGYIIADGGKLKQFFSRRAIIPGGFLLAENCPTEAVTCLLNFSKNALKKKAIFVEVRNYDDYACFSSAIQAAGFEYQPHLNFHVDTTSLESSLQKLSSTKRRDVKVSLKEGAELSLLDDETDLKAYYDLLRDLYKTKVKTPLFPYEFFQQLYQWPEGRIFVVKYQGRVLGGSVCVELPNRVLYEWFVCGLDRTVKNVYPSTLATWGAIEYASTHEITRFDMMGAGKPNHGYGVREFKAKFGGTLVEHGRFCYVANPMLFFIGRLAVKLLKHHN